MVQRDDEGETIAFRTSHGISAGQERWTEDFITPGDSMRVRGADTCPGLLESAYERCMAHELTIAVIACATQVALPIEYKGQRLDCGYRVDLLVEDQLIVEMKSVERILGIHEAQLLTYMKLAKMKTGLLINFNVEVLKDGIRRFVL